MECENLSNKNFASLILKLRRRLKMRSCKTNGVTDTNYYFRILDNFERMNDI